MNRALFRRFKTLMVMVIALFVLLTGRLAYLQIAMNDYYFKRAEENRETITYLTAPRGEIFDRNGNLLVTSRPGFVISLFDLGKGYDRETITILSGLLDIDEAEIWEAINRRQYLRYLPLQLKVDVSDEIVARISENLWKLQGVSIDILPIRQYVYNESGAHIFGFTGQGEVKDEATLRRWGQDGFTDYKNGDIVGQDGLERALEACLRGERGIQLLETDSRGRTTKYLDRQEPVPGLSLHLTLDMDLQQAAEAALGDRILFLQEQGNHFSQRGSAVAIDPNTGAILAMANFPSFDLNTVHQEYEALNADKKTRPLRNMAIKDTYMIGSTYKMITGLAAMEEGKMNDRTVYYCGGKFTAHNDTRSCHSFHGRLNIYSALAVSCNIFFYQAGLAAGIDRLAYYTRELGLGKYTGLRDIMGEAGGIVASREHKAQVSQYPWYPAETMIAAIGQSFHNYTPLQLAVYSSILANGGIHYRPHLVDRMVDFHGDTVFQARSEVINRADVSPHNLDIIRRGMHRVASQPGGTAYGHFHNFPVSVAAKTGSAQVAGSDVKIPAHSIFVCFAPLENPEIALAIVIEHGEYGALSATPVAREILEHFFTASGRIKVDS